MTTSPAGDDWTRREGNTALLHRTPGAQAAGVPVEPQHLRQAAWGDARVGHPKHQATSACSLQRRPPRAGGRDAGAGHRLAAEGGTKNCGAFIGYVHARYNDIARLAGPGGTFANYGFDNNTWQVSERNGMYSGDWMALGTPYLDLLNTWAGCRNYG